MPFGDRKTPLSRGKGLEPGGPPQRKTQMRAASSPARSPSAVQVRRHARRVADGGNPARPAPKRRPAPRDTGFSSAVRLLVQARDRGLCVRCGAPAADIDHRKGRGSGGQSKAEQLRTDTPAWGLTLCGAGNTDPASCHGWKESAPRARTVPEGYRIPRNGPAVDAAAIPVFTRDGWALFLNDGTRVPCPPPPTE